MRTSLCSCPLRNSHSGTKYTQGRCQGTQKETGIWDSSQKMLEEETCTCALECSKCDGCCDTGRLGGARWRSSGHSVALLVHSHGPWQGNSGWEPGWSGAWKGWDDSSATVAPVQNLEEISDERALHTMHDLKQTTVITQRRSQKMLSEQSTSKKQRTTLLARPWRPSPKRVNDKKRRGASASRSATRPLWPRQC